MTWEVIWKTLRSSLFPLVVDVERTTWENNTLMSSSLAFWGIFNGAHLAAFPRITKIYVKGEWAPGEYWPSINIHIYTLYKEGGYKSCIFMPISTIFTALFYPYIARERTAQNLISSVRSLSQGAPSLPKWRFAQERRAVERFQRAICPALHFGTHFDLF